MTTTATGSEIRGLVRTPLLDTMTCDHCVQAYNTKDGFHRASHPERHQSDHHQLYVYWQYGSTVEAHHRQQSATMHFFNNLTVSNCGRMNELIPGAAQNFAQSTYLGLEDLYLSDFCRAGIYGMSYNVQQYYHHRYSRFKQHMGYTWG